MSAKHIGSAPDTPILRFHLESFCLEPCRQKCLQIGPNSRCRWYVAQHATRRERSMSTPDNFNFADILAPSTPDEARIVELVRAVVRDELRKRDDLIIAAVADALRRHSKPRGAA
jgi:hypothetical protein